MLRGRLMTGFPCDKMLKVRSAQMVVLLAWLFGASVVSASDMHQGYVGSNACGGCHATEHAAWRGSHHDRAMEDPSDATVLGDFSGVEVTFGGVTSRFYRDGTRFMVRTDGPDGKLRDYAVKYTFGVTPLQQVLLELPGGRLQALGIAWDSRPEGQGGQRWFHLYPDVLPKAGERLHWTAPDQNWNHMCAECHSTDLLKRYDAATDSYATSYAEVDVGCEACHGPGRDHVAWAGEASRDADPRLAIRFKARDGVTWPTDPATGKPRRSVPLAGDGEVATCARCHSRRGRLTEAYTHGAPVGDSHRVALLEPGLYHADGQVLDEVYVYGSFLQSRMHAEGVTCSDCHDPHTQRLRAEGDGVCLACHDGARYALESHHHHPPASDAARCVACHMPATTYMVVDPRRDHGFRVPRPDLTVDLGTPNACNGCHADRDAAWAAAQVGAWAPNAATGYQRHARALHAAREGRPSARAALLAVARDDGQAGIARASAVAALGAWLDREVARALVQWLEDPEPLVRRAAVEALAVLPPQLRGELLAPRLNDPVREVRHAAVSALAVLPAAALGKNDATFTTALADYRQALALDADRPEGQLRLGVLLADLGDLDGAEKAYRRALEIEPGYPPALVNLADLLRVAGRDAELDALFADLPVDDPEMAVVHHARGLWLIRQKRNDAALSAIGTAARLAPEDARFGYVYAVALHGAGEVDAALAEVDRVLAVNPWDRDSLAAVVLWRQQRGEPPGDAAVRLLELQKVARGR